MDSNCVNEPLLKTLRQRLKQVLGDHKVYVQSLSSKYKKEVLTEHAKQLKQVVKLNLKEFATYLLSPNEEVFIKAEMKRQRKYDENDQVMRTLYKTEKKLKKIEHKR